MRDDTGLQRDVTHELQWDPITQDAEIAVSVRDGVVTLGGTIDSYAKKFAAVRAAERVSGIQVVADDLTVVLPGAAQRTDTELAHQVRDALRWDALVPDATLKARVEDGWVTLEGTVGWHYQRLAAERAVRNLTGVRGVSNLIALTPHVSAQDVSSRIQEALRRRAESDAAHIKVDAHDGTVTLRGRVRTWAERQDAEAAAWRAPGVSRVEDLVVIQP